MTNLKNPHAGTILKQEFLEPLGISQRLLAKSTGINECLISCIINGKRNITATTDLKLCKAFGLSEGYFLHIQTRYDTLKAKRKLGKKLDKVKPLRVFSEETLQALKNLEENKITKYKNVKEMFKK